MTCARIDVYTVSHVCFQCILAREDWPINTEEETQTSYTLKMVMHKMNKIGRSKLYQQLSRSLRYKSIDKIANALHVRNRQETRNIFVIDDDLGYFRPKDRISGQIYEIVPWYGPKQYHQTLAYSVHHHRRRSLTTSLLTTTSATPTPISLPCAMNASTTATSTTTNSYAYQQSVTHEHMMNDITVVETDDSLKKLGSVIQRIFKQGGGHIRGYLTHRMNRVFINQYKNQSKAIRCILCSIYVCMFVLCVCVG